MKKVHITQQIIYILHDKNSKKQLLWTLHWTNTNIRFNTIPYFTLPSIANILSLSFAVEYLQSNGIGFVSE